MRKEAVAVSGSFCVQGSLSVCQTRPVEKRLCPGSEIFPASFPVLGEPAEPAVDR